MLSAVTRATPSPWSSTPRRRRYATRSRRALEMSILSCVSPACRCAPCCVLSRRSKRGCRDEEGQQENQEAGPQGQGRRCDEGEGEGERCACEGGRGEGAGEEARAQGGGEEAGREEACEGGEGQEARGRRGRSRARGQAPQAEEGQAGPRARRRRVAGDDAHDQQVPRHELH